MSENIESKIKSPENKPEKKEIETWEGEGGTLEMQTVEDESRQERRGASTEIIETVVEEEKVEIGWREILTQAN